MMSRLTRRRTPDRSAAITSFLPRKSYGRRNTWLAWGLTLCSFFIYMAVSRWAGETQVQAHLAGNTSVVVWLNVLEITATLFFALAIFVIEYYLLLRPWQWAAQHDALTGLLNQGAFWTIAQNLWIRHSKKDSVTIMIADVDHFKLINDRAGHLQGDQVLMHISHTLAQLGSSTAVVGRIGGEEFAAMWIGIPPMDIYRTVEHWAELVQTIECPEGIGHVTLSMGIATSSPSSFKHRESVISLARQADEALYQAKANGRNRIEKAPF